MTGDSNKEGNTRAGEGESGGAASAPRTMKFALALLGGVFLAGVVLQSMLSGPGGVSRRATVLAGLAGFLGVMLAGLSKPWRRFLSSIQFAAPALFVLAGFSVLGTLILQNVGGQQLLQGYGPGLSRLIKGLFLDDIFHSLGFAAVLGLGAGALGLVVARRRRYNLRTTGSVLAHGGLILVLAGAGVGMVWGVKGRIDLHEGQETDSLVVPGRDGLINRLPLGFTLRLDDFRIEKYEPDYSLMVYALAGEKQKRLLSFKPGRDPDRKLAAHGLAVTGWWPDYRRRTVVEAAGDAGGGDVLAAARIDRGGKETWLFDEPGREAQAVEVDGKRLLLVWREERARRYLDSLAKMPASPHLLVVDGRELPARPGEEVPLPGGRGRVKILRFFHDFVMDPQTRQPANRSAEPRNPAVEVSISAAGGQESRRWLFARYPDFHGRGAGDELKLSYRYRPGGASRPDAILVGESRQLWSLDAGKLSARAAVKVGGEFTLGRERLRLAALLRPARRRTVEESAGSREVNPLLRVRLPSGRTVDVRPGKPVRYSRDRFLVLAPGKGETVRDYLSTVTVLEEGRPVRERQLVEVNSPLSHGGFSIYQADYRPEDPTYSGFQVVRDPGLYVVYLGFAANLLGVVLAIWGPRWQRRRRRREGGEA